MRTDRSRAPWRSGGRLARAAVSCAALALIPASAGWAQVRVSTATEVRSIDFTGADGLSERELRDVLQTRARGPAFGLRALLGRLPFISPPARHSFHPRVLQEDVVRLRRLYASEGFLEASIRYDVERVGDEDLLDITFVIDEGPAELVTDVAIVPRDSLGVLPVPPGEAKSWAREVARARELAGRSLSFERARNERDRLGRWWRDRGHLRANVLAFFEPDSLEASGRVLFFVDAGRRARIGPIRVTGLRSLSEGTVRRMLPFAPGDPYAEVALARARDDLQQLDIVRSARVEATDTATAVSDTLAPLEIAITEARPRLVSGQVGYVTDAGLAAETRWSHFNFTGGARTLTLSGLAQTGALALTDDPDIRYRGTVSLHQPHLFHRRLSGVVSPFIEYREDDRDRSLELGSNFTLAHRTSRALTTSLDYRASRTRVYEYRFGALVGGDVDLVTFLSQIAQGRLDSLGTRLTTSLVTLSATAETLDDLTNPRRGIMIRPTLQITTPARWSSESYWRADCTAYAFYPLTGGITLAGRASAGHLYPFGKSVPPSPDASFTSFLRLRDVTFTAGGSGDVRGWGYRRLGPKFPDIRFIDAGDTLQLRADGYVPLGGLSRTSFSLELRLPVPPLGPSFGSHVFLDGGRVFTKDRRFGSGIAAFEQETFFYSTGAGLDLRTPVGAIKLSVGYKLNPSLLDLVDAADLTDALLTGAPVDDLEEHESRRWHLHVAIGTSY